MQNVDIWCELLMKGSDREWLGAENMVDWIGNLNLDIPIRASSPNTSLWIWYASLGLLELSRRIHGGLLYRRAC